MAHFAENPTRIQGYEQLEDSQNNRMIHVPTLAIASKQDWETGLIRFSSHFHWIFSPITICYFFLNYKNQENCGACFESLYIILSCNVHFA